MPSDPEQPDYYKQRRSERKAVESNAKLLRQPHWYNVEVKVRDVSQSGFMAECSDAVRIGSFVALDVPGIGIVEAQVRWQIGQRMGGMFTDPISLAHCEWAAVESDPPKEFA